MEPNLDTNTLKETRSSSYWTLSYSPAVTAEQGAALAIPPDNGFPHALTRHQCGTAQELMEALVKIGRTPDQFTGSSDRFCRVDMMPRGFNVVCFPSYAAALLSDDEAKAPRCSEINPPCPFCRQADRLETIGWTNDRADGSEYVGDAVRCNRCDAIAPLPAWLSLGKSHL